MANREEKTDELNQIKATKFQRLLQFARDIVIMEEKQINQIKRK